MFEFLKKKPPAPDDQSSRGNVFIDLGVFRLIGGHILSIEREYDGTTAVNVLFKNSDVTPYSFDLTLLQHDELIKNWSENHAKH